MDIDHLPDYFIHTGFKLKKPADFFTACDRTELPKLYLILHSYELLLIFFLVGYLRGWSNLMLGIGTGFFVHILLDQMANSIRYGLRPFFYFFIFRGLKKFRRKLLTYERFPAGLS